MHYTVTKVHIAMYTIIIIIFKLNSFILWQLSNIITENIYVQSKLALLLKTWYAYSIPTYITATFRLVTYV